MTMIIEPRHCRAFTCDPRDTHDSECATGVARSYEGFSSGGRESVDSWTPGPKPLCHRHPTGPHPSGLPRTQWTPASGESTSNFALVRRLGRHGLRRAADAAAAEDRLDLGGAVAELAQDVR